MPVLSIQKIPGFYSGPEQKYIFSKKQALGNAAL